MSWVGVENDVTKYLAEDTETRQGIDAMSSSFVTYGTAEVMVSNVTYDTALALAEEIRGVEGVSMVTFDDSPEHYTQASALFSVSFSIPEADPASVTAMDEICGLLAGYDLSVYTNIGYSDVEMLRGEIRFIFFVAALIILIV